jgi:ribonuclease HI
MAKRKFYVVWKGHKTGVFKTWTECKRHIDGFKGAEYKSFLKKEEAFEAFAKSYEDYKGKNTKKPNLSAAEKKAFGTPVLNSISVDGACNNKGRAEYKGVYTDTCTELFLEGPFKKGTNNIMEFLALVHALAYCKKHKLDLPIYSDSKIAINWVQKKYINTKVEKTKENKKLFELIERALKWLKTNDYNNKILKWHTKAWGEIPADFGRK